jgi:hypothetical protein
LIQQFALFIAKEVLQGVLHLAKMLVHQPDDLREISTIERPRARL